LKNHSPPNQTTRKSLHKAEDQKKREKRLDKTPQDVIIDSREKTSEE